MGYGKTIISLVIGTRPILNLLRKGCKDARILVICSKNLITNWENDINKFYDGKLKYQIYHNDNVTKKQKESWVPDKNTVLILTTPEAMNGCYKANPAIEKTFIKQVKGKNNKNQYEVTDKPFLNDPEGLSYFHSKKWSTIIIDEIQEHTSITTGKWKAISSLSSS